MSTQRYAYLEHSALTHTDARADLGLQTSGGSTPAGVTAHPRFFTGFLTHPAQSASALLAVADVAATRYFRPGTGFRDPVVTGNGDRLRFESFSACGGVYARLDVLAEGVDGDDIGHGTTNVDVNTPLRDALSLLGPSEPLHMRVGPADVTVSTLDSGPIVEKKVPLPDRWVRGFAETQVIAAGFDPRVDLGRAETVRFLRSLPRGTTSGAGREIRWLAPGPGGSLRRLDAPEPGAVCLPGPARLAAFARLHRFATGLRAYGPTVAAGNVPVASAWELDLPGMRLTLMLSPQPSRGFSGEGAVLDTLAVGDTEPDADLVGLLLAWEPRIDVGDLAARAGITPERVRGALVRLGTAGRIGYDTAEAAYFHRELPYDATRAERDNPRLRNAQALVEAGKVRLEPERALITVDDHVHEVRLLDGIRTCTCEWWYDYRGGRGPCKHILAAGIARKEASA